ncbi:anti-sigma factor [Demequina sp. SYSU T00192]|uniref:Anti-sigma factor n=1 Tax=Demequina litoralis TaxID=3051660 RepID=A0ABT8G864_9MICO|nr:anti-sigma factor [Demequina sp. SYSU T00192]MDN4475326.1 anti-sigma factor [Demequina sp. SYSU T00192]
MIVTDIEDAYRESGALVHTLALRALGSVEEAEDVVRRVFASAAAGGSLEPRDLVNDAVDRITGDLERRVRAKLAALDDAALGTEGVTDERAVVAEADRILVRAALDRIDPDDRELLERALVHGVPRYELAMAAGLPEDALETRLRDALLALWPGPVPGEGHASVEGLASRALGIRIADGGQQHIASCRECRDAWRSLNDLVGSIARMPASAPMVAPRAGLWDEVREAVDAGPPEPEPDWRDEARRDAARAHRRRTLVMSIALVAASVVAGLAVALSQVLVEPRGDAVARTRLEDPRAGGSETGTAQLLAGTDGGEVIVVDGPYAEYPDAYLELWLIPVQGEPIALGQLTSGHYEVALPPSAPTAVGATVEISREPWDGDAGPSGDVIARGTLR